MSETSTASPRRAAPLGRTRAAFDRDEQRRRKREAVLRVAASAFNRRGFANTSMDDVASVLGVSKPTLYQYFKSKQELLYACHQVAMDNGEAGLALAAVHNGTGLEKLIVYLRRYMLGIFGDLGNCPVLTDVDSLTPDDREAVVARRKRISLATKELIALGVTDGSIANCDPKLASLFALGVVNWIPAWYREDGPNTPEEIMESFVTHLTSGLAAPTSPPASRRRRTKAPAKPS
ncbi:TetR/AcrR family transcriptional regulator [Xanthobacter sp. DSM 24535]|uniref:TetR/AcrR family transcriptional regulator n=1 Tax=Roseixanthobacter psychrophilus TaxID=3119917 RepID=UPI0037262ADF